MKIFENLKNQLKSIRNDFKSIIMLMYVKNDVKRCIKIKKL